MHVMPVVCVCVLHAWEGQACCIWLYARCSSSSCVMLYTDCATCSHPALTHPQCCHTHHQKRSYLERPHYSSSVSCEESTLLEIINCGWHAVHTPLDTHTQTHKQAKSRSQRSPTNAQVRNPTRAHWLKWRTLLDGYTSLYWNLFFISRASCSW